MRSSNTVTTGITCLSEIDLGNLMDRSEVEYEENCPKLGVGVLELKNSEAGVVLREFLERMLKVSSISDIMLS